MSRRHALEQHWQKLGEAREIMNSMKSLAFMETRKLARFLDIQREVVATLTRAAGDFLSFHPGCLPVPASRYRLFLLLGSERGFCGAFNETLLEQLERCIGERDAGIIACGRKLCGKLERDSRVLACLDGATVLDEVGTVLNRLVEALTVVQREHGTLDLTVLYHDVDQDAVVTQRLLPPFEPLRTGKPTYAYPPLLNLAPEQFFAELIDHYLFATLHEVAYLSLMAENHQRMQHLDGAIRYLDDTLDALKRRGNQLRQEEITEEIEVILLNADTTDLPPKGGHQW